MEHHESNSFRARSWAIARSKVRLARLSGAYSSTVDFLTLCSLAVFVSFSAPAVISGDLTVALAVAFLGHMDKVFKPLVVLSKVNFTVQKAVAAADRIFEFMDAKVEVLDAPDSLFPQTIEGRIQFDRVTFGYRPNRYVLEDFSLTIEPGETVAVVGSSGVGKSTIVNLLLRFYEPIAGGISIDGYPLDRLSLSCLRNKIGLVMQEPVLFSGSIPENIMYGDVEASEENVVRAAQSANAHDFIVGLPKGYDTQIGERGVTLSVGQRQRIAIARALLKNPSILILDEATSNIDSESESLIQDALRKLAQRRTMIIIGHRLSSIMDADRIVVLEDGGFDSDDPEVSRGRHPHRPRVEGPRATSTSRGAWAVDRPREVRFRQGVVGGAEEVVELDEGPRTPENGSASEAGVGRRGRQGTATDPKQAARGGHPPSEGRRRPRPRTRHRHGRGLGFVPERSGRKEPFRFLPAALERRVRYALHVCGRGRLWRTGQQRFRRRPRTRSNGWHVVLPRPRRSGVHDGCVGLVHANETGPAGDRHRRRG